MDHVMLIKRCLLRGTCRARLGRDNVLRIEDCHGTPCYTMLLKLTRDPIVLVEHAEGQPVQRHVISKIDCVRLGFAARGSDFDQMLRRVRPAVTRRYANADADCLDRPCDS